jgi:trehalose-6-phosphatase
MTVVIYGDEQCKVLSEIMGGQHIYYLGYDGFTIYGQEKPIALIDKQEITNDIGEKVRWFIKASETDWDNAQAIFIGKKPKDENAFRIVNTRGISILVSDHEKVSSAGFRVNSIEEVEHLLKKINN